MKITAKNDRNESIRISLPSATWEGAERYGVGRKLTGIYVSPRARRCVIETDSIWDNGHGQCVGTSYELIEDDDQLNRLAERFAVVASALESAGLVTAEEL